MSNTIGQSVLLDNAQGGLISDADSLTNIAVAVPVALVGTLTMTDGDGNVRLSLTAGQSGAFQIAGNVPRLDYQLSSAADLGSIAVSFRPV